MSRRSVIQRHRLAIRTLFLLLITALSFALYAAADAGSGATVPLIIVTALVMVLVILVG